MSDVKENEESGQDLVTMDEEKRLDDMQAKVRDESASLLPVEEASNGTGTEKVVAEPEDEKMEIDGDVDSKAVTKSDDQSSLHSEVGEDAAQDSLQPESQTTLDVKTVADVANVNVNDACNKAAEANQANQEGNEAEGSDKVNQVDETGQSNEGDEAEKVNQVDETREENEAEKVNGASEAQETQQVSQPDEGQEVEHSGEGNGVNEGTQTNGNMEGKELPEKDMTKNSNTGRPVSAVPASDVQMEDTEEPEGKDKLGNDSVPALQSNPSTTEAVHPGNRDEKENQVEKEGPSEKEKEVVSEVENGNKEGNAPSENDKYASTPAENGASRLRNSFLDDDHAYGGNEAGTEEEQLAFMKELESFYREKCMEFKPPKFYGEGLNCLKLWRSVMRLGGYDKVTACKLWRQVGESFKPPKTCTTVSWTFRCFYEKALLEYERHMTQGGEIMVVPVASPSVPIVHKQQTPVSGRARRDAAARAMQGWHSQRLLGNGEVSDPIIKDKNSLPLQKREKQLKSFNLLKRKKPPYLDSAVKAARTKPSKPEMRVDTAVVDIGPPADWVKINVQKTKDCFEVYALVPGLLREEVRVQSDPAGRLVITGEPELLDNPWGVTPFKKVVTLPSRIDPHQTSAVVTLHGQLFVRVPFEQSE